MHPYSICLNLIFSNATATTEIYTLSLHDALPISRLNPRAVLPCELPANPSPQFAVIHKIAAPRIRQDRKSTRLNSSHTVISYAVFCLKKKKQKQIRYNINQNHKQPENTKYRNQNE